MSGNVREWCHDFYASYPSISVVNPSGPQTGEYRLMRGGCYYHDAWSSGASVRGATGRATNCDYTLGFRVVRRPGEVTY